ncbi:hypothetical protein PENTCL1PPCAC_24932, partial [Pristionchus entomophagus]
LARVFILFSLPCIALCLCRSSITSRPVRLLDGRFSVCRSARWQNKVHVPKWVFSIWKHGHWWSRSSRGCWTRIHLRPC